MRIAEAIHGYAKSRGWGPNDYHIFMFFNTNVYALRVKVVAGSLDGRTEEQAQADYDDVMDLIEERLKERVFNYYGLVLMGMSDYQNYPGRGPSDAEVEIDEALINNGASWSEPFPPGTR